MKNGTSNNGASNNDSGNNSSSNSDKASVNKNNDQESQKAIKALASTLKVEASDLAFLNTLEPATIEQLRLQMVNELTQRHHAFKQSVMYAAEQLPRVLRGPASKMFRRVQK